ncbi:MAG: hypothetical protein JNK75_11760 [Betaproteobacteria bacterium]|nr:hypothetical protein [Betaproteobacteria bacterium]
MLTLYRDKNWQRIPPIGRVPHASVTICCISATDGRRVEQSFSSSDEKERVSDCPGPVDICHVAMRKANNKKGAEAPFLPIPDEST